MATGHDLRERESCGETAGCGLPSGFFRLRYFHGKQMRLADYVDEQRYHAGKMRFHNDRLHGAGILCGLRVSLLDPGGTVLRVGCGAALDDCGREIVVGFDQCVDVGAWYRREHRERKHIEQDACHPDPDNKVRVCVAIRYAECSQAPEPAPANPCSGTSGCGCGGSQCGSNACDPCGDGAEYGRVSEQFELRLMFHDDADRLTRHKLFPDKAAIEAAVLQSSGGISLLKALALPIRERCPASQEEWLLLACFDVVVTDGDEPKVETIGDIDYDCASQVLLSTETIQYLLNALYAEVDPAPGGPEIADIALQRLAKDKYQFVLSLTASIDPRSLDRDDNSVNLRHLANDGWELPGGNAVSVDYSEERKGKYSVDGPAIYVTVDNQGQFLAAGERYQLFTPRETHPVVDAQLRRLHPRDLEWRFILAVDPDTGDLVLGAG